MTKIKPAVAVALTGWKAEPWLAELRKALPGRLIVDVLAGQEPPTPCHLFCWKPTTELFARLPRPLTLLSAGAGVDHIFKAMPPEGVPITRIVDPDLTGRMVEYVVLHCLMHLRRMDEALANQHDRRWRSKDFPAARQVTVGLLGVGELAQASARALMAVGFDVRGWSRTSRAGLPFSTFTGESGKAVFLAGTDILVSLLPSTPETRGMIGNATFSALRRDGAFGAPVFINAGRGDTVDEPGLLQALTSGTLRAASLDVFITEPLPQDSPFWTLPNVFLTPHNAADSTPAAVVAAVAAEIERFEAGLPALHGVDAARGY